MKSINAGGTLISFDQPIVMGILNATPDSFYNNGRDSSLDAMVLNASQMLKAGATLLDIGGQSTKPDASKVSIQEELDRTIPVIQAILKKHPNAILSIDTFSSKVAKEALAEGVYIVNDISGGDMDDNMLHTVAQYNAVYVCMHMQGTPQTMQQNPKYENVVTEVYQGLQNKLSHCRAAGIKDVILDVGFGFGKTVNHNFALLNALDYFQHLNCPILAGLSRKSMIYKVLKTDADNALNGTSVCHTIALLKGANILRVHDVQEAMECIRLCNQL